MSQFKLPLHFCEDQEHERKSKPVPYIASIAVEIQERGSAWLGLLDKHDVDLGAVACLNGVVLKRQMESTGKNDVQAGLWGNLWMVQQHVLSVIHQT